MGHLLSDNGDYLYFFVCSNHILQWFWFLPSNVLFIFKLICFIFQKKLSSNNTSSTFDYLYEFSETRKVLEEFFKCPPPEEDNRLDVEFQDLKYELRRQESDNGGNSYVGQRLAKNLPEVGEYCVRIDPRKCVNNLNITGIQVRNVVSYSPQFQNLLPFK